MNIATHSRLNYAELRLRAAQEREHFAQLLADVPYERKGILYSEMFFLWLCTHNEKPKRILESGRARGQSTLILAKTFPDSEIISIEYDKDSPDVPVAAERLRGCANVRLLFGDATKMLPDLIEQGDVVLIDGPKGFRGLRLALGLVGGGKAPFVFVHDTTAGSADRDFLDRYLPGTLYSDSSLLAAETHQLDLAGDTDIPAHLRFVPGRPHYGYGLACLRPEPDFPMKRLLFCAAWAGLRERLLSR